MKQWLHRLGSVTFKRKLLLYSLFLSIIPVLTVGSVASLIASRSIQSEVDQHHRYMLDQMQVQLNQFIKSLNIASIYISTNLAVEKSVRDGPSIDNLSASLEMNETIRRFRSSSPIRYNVSILYKRHNYVYSNFYDAETIARMRLPVILDKMKPNANESIVVPANTFDDQPDLLLFRPIPIHSAYTDGVLVLHVSPEDILSFVGSVEHGHGTRILVADERNRIVISSKREEMGQPLDRFGGLSRLVLEGERGPRVLDFEGAGYKVQAATSSWNGWTYIAMTPMAELTHQSRKIRIATWAVVAVLALIWASVAMVGSRRMYVPIQRLADKLLPWPKSERKHRDGLAALDAYFHQLVDANNRLHSQLSEQFPYLKQGLFQQLLRGEMSERDFLETAERLNVRLEGECVFVCIAEADDISRFHETYREKDRALIHYALLKMMEETFHGFSSCVGFTSKSGQVVLVVGSDSAGEETCAMLKRCADEARGHVRQYFRFTVSIAVSSPLDGYADIGKGYEEAVALLNHRLVMGENVTITADNADAGLKRASVQMVERQKQIVFHVIHGNLDDSRRLLAQLVSDLPQTQMKPEAARGLFTYMLGELDYLLQQTGCDIQQATGIDLYQQLYRFQSLAELERWLADGLFPAVKAHIERQTLSKQTKTVQQVMQYVRDHMHDELSLQSVADRFGLSVSYLSKMFKDESGRNFSDFVLELRMNKAKDWLEHTDLPIKDIAEKLGYASVQNFNRVFKQWSGLPPGEYRKRKRDAS